MKTIARTILAGLLLALLTLLANTAIAQKTVTDFKLKNVDETTVSLADYPEAQGFIIIFTCNHCPFAKKYESRIIDLHNEFAPQGFPVVAINPNDPEIVPEDSFEKMQALAKEKNYPFKYLYDQTQKVAKQYEATRTPHVYVIVPQGKKYAIQYEGAIDDNVKTPEEVTQTYVADAVNALLEGEPVPTAQTKAIGCTIKWSE